MLQKIFRCLSIHKLVRINVWISTVNCKQFTNFRASHEEFPGRLKLCATHNQKEMAFAIPFWLRVAGLEPAQHFCPGILSPLRLPIPPYPLAWTLGDLNPGPSGYEPDALTN